MKKSAPPNFDPLAGAYRALEFLAFGRDLERARFRHLDHLADRRRILVLGEGDGRCLVRLLRCAPHAHIDCLDLSPVMLARAAARLDPTDRSRVRFQAADLLATEPPGDRYDAIVTCFFLDCFTASQVAALVARLTARLEPDALWLWADFVLPARGLRRWRAQAWLAVLYTFFRWQTGLAVKTLPPSEAILVAAGGHCEAQRDFQAGLVRSALFRYPRPPRPQPQT